MNADKPRQGRHALLSPLPGLADFRRRFPRLTPWATFCRSSAAPQLRSEQKLTYIPRAVTEEGWAHVGRMASLTWLSLQYCGLDDRGLQQLSDLTGLKQLHVNNTLISDESLNVLKSFPHLEELWIMDTRISRAGRLPLEKAFPQAEVLH